jgi:beta-phosphoglucomutase-like phosphatase (HAD superfamily)
MATGVLPAAAPTLDGVVTGWRTALRAARSALESAESLPADERHDRARRLAAEVAPTQDLLRALARDLQSHSPVLPLVVSPLEARRLLGLPQEIAACVFNLDGVLIGSAAIHIAAWADVFDNFLSTRAERTGGLFAPFNPPVDYLEHVHARPRADGVRAFLASRGIRLPEGTATDPPTAETVHGLANAKNAALRHRLDVQGVYAFDGSRSYLELAHEAGVQCAVISASANTHAILERTGLADLVDGRVDGAAIEREHLQVKPAPDMLLAACRLLGVEPERAAAFETTRAGVEAGRTAGFDVIVAVDGAMGADRRELLRAAGADIVVSGIGDLLEHRPAA